MHRSKKGLLDHLVGATGGSWVSRTAGWEGPNVIFPVWSYPLRECGVRVTRGQNKHRKSDREFCPWPAAFDGHNLI